MEKRKAWSLQEVVLLAFIAFIFGAVFMGGGYLYAPLEATLSIYGYAPFANQILFGIWTIAAPVAAMIVRRPGTAILGELLAALAEMLYGSYFGAGVLISGLIQGAGSELGFTLTKYKRYDSLPLWYGAVGTTVLSFIYEYFKYGYMEFSPMMIIGLLVVRFISVAFFNVFLVQAIMKIYQEIESSIGAHNG
ncbi:energy-coupling factor transport system substrate-specific component [Granulicatella balaenopterae]|uniref:Energy-coupling factor transport system substrate-specific component n=1 Tax=Granulicatella balaenopterae TaxID=137733 RepID=A0A1H9MJC0_9LACT|nr:ECF transporter S component [Granulicatella balaenopterae]SER23557.1 energy-coupling factor transport system substrate-specific component [Granulicatella balaenopterae]